MKILALLLGCVLIVAAAAVLWQHLRYLKIRRDIVHDVQPLLHGSNVFHVLTFLRTAPGDDVIEAVRKLRSQLETDDAVRMVYAGKVALNALESSQVGAIPWTAIVLVQHPTRAAYDKLASTEAYRSALAGFTDSYSHGLSRSAALNMAIPAMLLGRRAIQIVRREPSHFPFVPDPEAVAARGEDADRMEQLRAGRELGRDAVVVVNLLKGGSAEERKSNDAYGARMLALMAEGVHGPTHIGPAVRIEGEASFDTVALVYYPGVDYFAAMGGSTFFQGIVGGKQLGDTQASITVPILSRL